MNTETLLKVTEIQRFCMHDGPGVRTTVFLKGCPLRCAWCHNPETQKSCSELLFYRNKCIGCGACAEVCANGVHTVGEKHIVEREKCLHCFSCTESCPTGALEACGEEMTVSEILSVIEKDRAFYGTAGGVTLSGGEPFMQGKAAIELLKACKTRDLSTAVETCGYADTEFLLDAVPYTDLFLWDLKDTYDKRHKQYTGVSNSLILSNLRAVNERGAKIRLRCIMVNGVNTCTEHYNAAADIAKEIKNLDGVELIPYHAYGGTKSTFIGKSDNGNKAWIPDSEQLLQAKEILTERGIKVIK